MTQPPLTVDQIRSAVLPGGRPSALNCTSAPTTGRPCLNVRGRVAESAAVVSTGSAGGVTFRDSAREQAATRIDASVTTRKEAGDQRRHCTGLLPNRRRRPGNRCRETV